MPNADGGLPCQVGNGARGLENAVVRAGGEAHAFHRSLQGSFACGVELAQLAQHLRRHAGVGETALKLDFPCGQNTLPNCGR